MSTYYNPQLIAQLHNRHGGNWAIIQREYYKVTKHDVTSRHLRDVHHYWTVRREKANTKIRTRGNIKYDIGLIKQLLINYGVNWQLIYKKYSAIKNLDIGKDNFISVCRYHMKIMANREINQKITSNLPPINEITCNLPPINEITCDLPHINEITCDLPPINDNDWDF